MSSAIVNTATQMASAQNSDSVNVLVLKKALDQQKASANTLLDTLLPSTGLATSGTVGTQVNTWA